MRPVSNTTRRQVGTCASSAAILAALERHGEAHGLDGAYWTIEGRRKDIFRAVHRWSPHGAIHDLGRLFFALAGPPLAEAGLY